MTSRFVLLLALLGLSGCRAAFADGTTPILNLRLQSHGDAAGFMITNFHPGTWAANGVATEEYVDGIIAPSQLTMRITSGDGSALIDQLGTNVDIRVPAATGSAAVAAAAFATATGAHAVAEAAYAAATNIAAIALINGGSGDGSGLTNVDASTLGGVAASGYLSTSGYFPGTLSFEHTAKLVFYADDGMGHSFYLGAGGFFYQYEGGTAYPFITANNFSQYGLTITNFQATITNHLRFLTTLAAPASNNAAGSRGEVRTDATNLYLYTGSNKWLRVPGSYSW